MKIIQGIPKSYRNPVIVWSYKYFNHLVSKKEFTEIINNGTNWDLSLMLVEDDDEEEVLGLYLLGNEQISSVINTHEYTGMTGIEGILLVIDDSIRGQGWGTKLKDYTMTMGFDYVWGQQYKSLNNLDEWLKRRTLMGESEYINITAEFF